MPFAYLAWMKRISLIPLTHVYALLDHRLDTDCEFSLGRPTTKHRKIISSWCLKIFLFGFRE